MKASYFSHTMPNGMRIVHKRDASPVVYCGLAIKVGTRDERDDELGMAHFVEHLLFKGTKKRRGFHIINRLETIGGSLDAYTTKEETFIYAAIPTIYFERAVELLSDVFFNSTFPENEIEKEIDVVLDEIQSYNDSPSELIYDEFETMIFKNSPLGRNILGNEAMLQSFTQKKVKVFFERNYTPNKVVFFSLGDVDFEKVIRLTEKYFSVGIVLPEEDFLKEQQSVYLPQRVVRQKDTFQTHCVIGNRAYAFNDRKRLPLFLLNNILGGPNLNSRLNLLVREKHGLVYTIESEFNSYSDTGVFSIYFGCDLKHRERSIRLVEKELQHLRETQFKEKQLIAYKRQLLGQLLLNSQNRESLALSMAKSFSNFNHFDELDEVQRKFDLITAEQINEVANEVFDPHSLTYLFYE